KSPARPTEEAGADAPLLRRHHGLWGAVAVVSALALGIAQAVVFVPVADAAGFANSAVTQPAATLPPTLVPVAGPPSVVPRTVQTTTPVTQQTPTRTTTIVRRVTIDPRVLAAILAAAQAQLAQQ